MAETQRLGLEMFGGWAGGGIGDRDYKFSTRDRQILDAFLQALEGHRHTGGAPLENPTAAPGLALNPVGSSGDLPGGVTFFYVVSYVDEWGLESGMSLEASVTTPAPFASPPAPAVSPRSGGALVAGTYYYQVTYTQAGTGGEVLETLASPTTVVTLAGVNHTARVGLPPLPAGASGWRIYRLGQNDPYAFLVHEDTTTSDTFWDDTGAVPGTATTPLDNTTNSQNTVQVTIPDAGLLADPVTDGQLRRWRIYRTDTSGDYSDTSMVHDVVETVNETAPYGPLVGTYVDDGDPLLAGSPLLVSTTFNPPESAAAAPGAGATAYTPLPGGLLTGTDVETALNEADSLLQAQKPRVQVTLSAVDGLTANNWGVSSINGLGWVIPQEFDGWIVENLSAGLTAPLTAGDVTVYLQWSNQGAAYAPSDAGVHIVGAGGGAWATQYGVQNTPYSSQQVVQFGDILKATTVVGSAPTPSTAGAMLAVTLRHP